VSQAQEFPNLLVISPEVSARYPNQDIELYYAFGDKEVTEYDFALPRHFHVLPHKRKTAENSQQWWAA